MAYFVHWLFAFALIAATFNPTEWNYIRWSVANFDQSLSVVVLSGLLLIVAYIIYLRATLRSIGAFGMGLVMAVVAALIQVLSDMGLLSLDNQPMNTWLGIFALSAVLGVGLSWSHVRRALSGQADIDDIDE